MDFLSDFDEQMAADDTYDIHFGKKIQRIGRVFSYTFWRTEVRGEIFWSMQGHGPDGAVWIVTKYFGPKREGKRFQQEVILHHPVEKQIKMYYTSSCAEGMNCIKISRQIVHHFRNGSNSLWFEFRLLKVKRRPYPKRTLWETSE